MPLKRFFISFILGLVAAVILLILARIFLGAFSLRWMIGSCFVQT